MSEVRTFWCEPAGRYRHELVVLGSDDRSCPKAFGMCCARVVIANEVSDSEWAWPADDDPRWPTHCDDCGADLGEGSRGMSHPELYRGAPDGVLRRLAEMPVGATWDATWWHRGERYKPPDDVVLVVKLPNGHDWMPDGPAANSDKIPGWTRTGDPRQANVTARPSIGSPWPPGHERYYHGFLTDGLLKACGDSRT